MSMSEVLLQELETEAQATRRLLERVPDGKLDWRPHAKSRTLGALATHVATVPGFVAELVSSPSPAQAPDFGDPPTPPKAADLVLLLEDTLDRAKKALGNLDDAAMMSTWRLMAGEKELIALPRAAFLRTVMLNHWYHHRGQLSVYLRELDVLIPSIYGPSADENPFA
ncbi:MAG: DinB family protein [Thermoanaerobaculia bacterium]